MKRALVSVSNKDGLEELAAALVAAGIEIISTGGTFRFLRDLSSTTLEVKEDLGGGGERVNRRR